MLCALRDDDISFETNVDVLRMAWEGIDVPISVSVIPFYFSKNQGKMLGISKNHLLTDYLKTRINDNRIEILLHGITHSVKKTNGKIPIKPEMVWRNLKKQSHLLFISKNYLEKIFNGKVTVFVAPQDAIVELNIKMLSKAGMHFCGINDGRYDSFIEMVRLLPIRLRRRFSNKKYGYPLLGLIRKDRCYEQFNVTLTSFEKMVSYYHICAKNNWNFVISTHY